MCHETSRLRVGNPRRLRLAPIFVDPRLLDGHASVTLTANGGHEWATNDRPDGDKTFYGANIAFSMDLNERVGFFLFAWLEHNAYDEDRALLDENHETLELYTRSDDLYELSGSMT